MQRTTRGTSLRALAATVAVLAALLVTAPAHAGPDVTTGDTGNEPHNAVVNPQNPSQVAVGQGCTVRISNDFGQTFNVIRNARSAANGPCRGDPSVAFDSQGRLFFTHLEGAPQFDVYAGQVADTTTVGTQNVTTVLVSNNADGANDDKQWIVADANPASPYRDNLYLVWTNLGAPNSQITFSRSTNQGATWSAPQFLSAAGEGFVWPAHAAVGPNGDVYLAYHTTTCQAANTGTMQLLRDGFGGQNFAAGTVPQKTTAIAAGGATVTCNVQGTGNEIPGTDFWLQGTMQPWVLPDPARAGNVYIVANDDPNNAYANGDDADIVIARSTDFGQTFAAPTRVDHGPGQTFAVIPTAAIDQDGNIAVQWYDNRANLLNAGTGPNGVANFLLDVYGTASNDGGLTFTNDFRISDAPFDPDISAPCRFGPAMNCGTVQPGPQTLRIGEYNGLWAVDGIGYATWTGNATPPAGGGLAGAGVQTIYFDVFSVIGAYADRFEPNESIDAAVVGLLGSGDSFNERRLTLHSATDVDFFKVVAAHTGTLEVSIAFNEIIADLRLRAQDRLGNVVSTALQTTGPTGTSVERLVIPVVQGETYYVEVRDPAPAALAPQSSYDLSVVNRPAPVPFGLDLLPSSDGGASDSDDLTNDATPTIRVRVDQGPLIGIPFSVSDGGSIVDDAPGYKIRIFDNGAAAGFADTSVGNGVYDFTFPSSLSDGLHSITAKVLIVDGTDPSLAGSGHSIGHGGESAALTVAVDTVAPGSPSTPDLLASSDSGGVSVDDITTLTQPVFGGTAEVNTRVRLRANGGVVGSGPAGTEGSDGVPGNGLGTFDVGVSPLSDGVYAVTASAEDLAGNESAPSAALSVTIANQSLALGGATGDVTVDLGAGTVTGYPVPGGVVGIAGIPVVNLDVGGNALTVLGTAGDDGLTYTPTGASSGFVTRANASQAITFVGAAGNFTIDPGAGDDQVTVVGTTGEDTVTGVLDVLSTVQVNALKTVRVPNASVERLTVSTLGGADTVNVTVTDAVSAAMTVDGGLPGTTKPKGDSLVVIAGSPKAKITKQSGPVKGSGSVFVTYPQTTNAASRVDYQAVEAASFTK